MFSTFSSYCYADHLELCIKLDTYKVEAFSPLDAIVLCVICAFKQVTQWFEEKATLFLENSHLGSSLSENEGLLREYKEYEQKSKVRDHYTVQ